MRKSPVIGQVEVRIDAIVNPSECSEKVISAISNVFDGCPPELKYGSLIVARCNGIRFLNTIYEQVRSRSAMGVLRRILTDNRISNTTWFLLNKQAAAAGIVAVIDNESESPLGPIRVTTVSDELDKLVDWLTPLE
jgi:predicted RNA binding protein with dsRBD fold (UPF0201 family)